MSFPKLPLRLKVDIRDRFEAAGSPAQKALNTLEEVVGLKAVCNIEWDLLHHSLGDVFPDKTTFVPTIIDVIVAWCDVLSTRLEDDKFADWTENVIDMLQSAGAIKLRLQVLDIDRPTTTWSTEQSSFVISLPRKVAILSHRASSGFETDFARLLTNEPSAVSTGTTSVRQKDDDWAEVDEAGEEARIKLSTMSLDAVPQTERMPAVNTVVSPELLFPKLTPYIMRVVQSGSGVLSVQGTHSPSLQFLSEYLQRWVKKDHQDTRKCPLLRITIHESHFGVGISHDKLIIEPYDTYQERRGVEMNPLIVLALIENVLGYRSLPSVSANIWEFRRDVAFK